MIGTIDKYDQERAWGLIKIATKRCYFFHVSGWHETFLPQVGMQVEFNVVPDTRHVGRVIAVAVKLAEHAGAQTLETTDVQVINGTAVLTTVKAGV